MGTFKSTKTFFASPEIIPAIVKDITGTFTNEGYQVQAQDLISGGYDISITKGNMFKAVLGMKTALKVHIYPANEQIRVDAGVGIFGQQAVPIPLPAKLTGIRTITPLLRQEENFVPNVVNRCLLKLSFVADAELNCSFRKALTVG